MAKKTSGIKSLGKFQAEPVAAFKTRSFWVPGDNGITNLWFSENFQKNIIDKSSKKISYYGEFLERWSVIGALKDSEVNATIGYKAMVSVDEYLAWMKDVVSKQPKGEKGLLNTNGENNNRYVLPERTSIYDRTPIYVVGVSWREDKWRFNCRGHGQDDHWYMSYMMISKQE